MGKGGKRRGGFARTQPGFTFYMKNQHMMLKLEAFFNQSEFTSFEAFEQNLKFLEDDMVWFKAQGGSFNRSRRGQVGPKD